MAKNVRPLCAIHPKKRAYTRYFYEAKYVSFFIKNDELPEKCNEIWDKVSNPIKKGFDSEPVYSEKYLRTKTKSDEEKISKNFQENKLPKEGSQCICLPIILIDSVLE